MGDLQYLDAQDLARFGGFTAQSGTGPAAIASFGTGDALPNRTLLIVSGWAARQRWLADGRRQILKLDLPGDVCGMFASAGAADPPIALTHMRVVWGALPKDDGAGGAMRRILEYEEWCLFNQLLRLGAMTARERMAHLLLELYHRLASVRLAQDFCFEMPLTQEQLADVLGLSSVHINRTLQALRHDGLVECHGARVRLLKPDEVAHVAHFARPHIMTVR